MKLRVKEICASEGITLQELAERLGMKRESLSRSINGNPTLETLEKIANELNVHIAELFDTPSNDKLTALVRYGNDFFSASSIQELENILTILKANGCNS